MPSSRLDKAEQRIRELKHGSEEITPNAAQKHDERENTKEKLRGIEGRKRGSKPDLQGVAGEEQREWENGNVPSSRTDRRHSSSD